MVSGVLVLSVPGSGTRFLAERVLSGLTVIVEIPIRHPYLTLLSNWNRRASPNETLVGVPDMRIIADCPATFFKVDAAPGERAGYLARLRAALGCLLPQPEWRPDPAWAMRDTTGLRAVYDREPQDARLAPVLAPFRADPALIAFYRRFGYEV